MIDGMKSERQRLDSLIKILDGLSLNKTPEGIKHYQGRQRMIVNYFTRTEQWWMLEGILQYLEVPEDLTLKERVAFFRLWVE